MYYVDGIENLVKTIPVNELKVLLDIFYDVFILYK